MQWSYKCSKIALFIPALLATDIAHEVNLRIRILLPNTSNFFILNLILPVTQSTCNLEHVAHHFMLVGKGRERPIFIITFYNFDFGRIEKLKVDELAGIART